MADGSVRDAESAAVHGGEVTVAGVRSPYMASGSHAGGNAVVFVHGNPGSSEDWRSLVGRVGAFGRAIALDMPGFGSADKPEDFEYTVAGYARHLDGALRELDVGRAHLVLHDFGGAWGLAWAAANPARLASVTLINIGLVPGYRWHYLARLWRTPLVGEIVQATATRFAFHLLLKHGNPRGLPRRFVDRMYDDYDQGTRRAVLRLYRATSNPGGLADAMGATFRQLDVPALVIWGAADPYVPVVYAERQREFFRRATVVILERSGHWPFADDPEAVDAALVPFLRDQSLSCSGMNTAFSISTRGGPPPVRPLSIRSRTSSTTPTMVRGVSRTSPGRTKPQRPMAIVPTALRSGENRSPTPAACRVRMAANAIPLVTPQSGPRARHDTRGGTRP